MSDQKWNRCRFCKAKIKTMWRTGPAPSHHCHALDRHFRSVIMPAITADMDMSKTGHRWDASLLYDSPSTKWMCDYAERKKYVVDHPGASQDLIDYVTGNASLYTIGQLGRLFIAPRNHWYHDHGSVDPGDEMDIIMSLLSKIEAITGVELNTARRCAGMIPHPIQLSDIRTPSRQEYDYPDWFVRQAPINSDAHCRTSENVIKGLHPAGRVLLDVDSKCGQCKRYTRSLHRIDYSCGPDPLLPLSSSKSSDFDIWAQYPACEAFDAASEGELDE